MTDDGVQREQRTDLDLAIAARRGDMEAFGALARRYRGGVTLVAQQIVGSRCLAEDVAQEVMILALTRLPQLQDLGRFGVWLYSITRHQALRVASRERRVAAAETTTLDALLTDTGRVAPDVAGDFARAQEWEAFCALVDRLPPDYAIVIKLRYWEEWPAARMAQFLSLPVTTVNWRLHRARKWLREHWETSQK